MESKSILLLTEDELRRLIKEAVNEGINDALNKSIDTRVDGLPSELTRKEFMELFKIKSTKATEIFKSPGFPIVRIGKEISINTAELMKWLKEQEDSPDD